MDWAQLYRGPPARAFIPTVKTGVVPEEARVIQDVSSGEKDTLPVPTSDLQAVEYLRKSREYAQAAEAYFARKAGQVGS